VNDKKDDKHVEDAIDKTADSNDDNKSAGNHAASDDKASKDETPTPAEKVIVAETVVKPSVRVADNSVKNTEKKSFAWVLSLICLVLIIISVAGGFFWWRSAEQNFLQQQADLQLQLTAALQRVDEQAGGVRTLQQNIDRQAISSEQQLEQTQQQLKVLQQQLSSQQKRLLALSTTDRSDWLLAEADYLMRLANQRLLMGKELDGALQLLIAADEVFIELDDSALFPVREALADNMSALKTAARFDVEGVYLKLGALAKQADQLRLFQLPELTLAEPKEQIAETWQQRLSGGFSAALEKLSGYISYRNRGESYKPLLAPEYEAAVRQNLHLMFEQAQMSLLSGKQELYLDSLQKAIDWLDAYYSLDKTATETIRAEIAELMQLNVVIELPDISSAPRALKNYIETIHSLPTAVRPSNSTTNQSSTNADEALL
jgi:uroporphyrin-3 C-methyltransferase